jgi:signal transduction histidine kinase
MQGPIDRAPCGFAAFGRDGVVREVNTTLLEVLGAKREDVVGRPFEELLTIPSRIFYQTHFFPLLKLQSRVEEVFMTMRGANGDVAMLTNAALREQEDVFDCVLMRLRERQKWEDEILRAKRLAEDANRAKTALLSMMSHDLRTPLGAIAGYCEILSLGIRGTLTEDQLGDVRRIRRASDYLLALIDDVLNYSKLDSGVSEPITVEEVTTDTVIATSETLIGPRFEEEGIYYRRESCAPGITVLANPDRLQQILLNLLSNAAKFTPRGGSVTLTCETAGAFTLIKVADTGPGIPADHIERIFEPFVQVPGTSAPAGKNKGSGNTKGYGLGLAISRGLARRMKGELTVESEPGNGATFTIVLPRGPGESR